MRNNSPTSFQETKRRGVGLIHTACIVTLFSLIITLLATSVKADETAESRARAMYHDLRCMVCGGQSLAESNAELAVGMRRMILERLETGESEAQIKSYLTQRYGDEILMQPPVRQGTLFIWLMPFLLLIGGLLMMLRMRGKRHG